MAHIVIPAEDMIRLDPGEQPSVGPTLAELAARRGIGLPPPTSSHYLCTIGEFATRHAPSQGDTTLDERAPLLVHSTVPYKEILMSQLQSIQLRPGDILVVTTPMHDGGAAARADVKEELAKVLPTGVKVAVLPEGTELMTVSAAGWVSEAKSDDHKGDEPVKSSTAPSFYFPAYGLHTSEGNPHTMKSDPEFKVAGVAGPSLTPAVCGACHNDEHALCDGTCYCGCATNRARKTPVKCSTTTCSDQQRPYVCTACTCGDHELCAASTATNCDCVVCADYKAKVKPVTSPFFK